MFLLPVVVAAASAAVAVKQVKSNLQIDISPGKVGVIVFLIALALSAGLSYLVQFIAG